jgi:hypothetical protein
MAGHLPDHRTLSSHPTCPRTPGLLREASPVRVMPCVVVDRLPDRWWRPGNLHHLGPISVHFCDNDHVKSIEINGRLIAQGRRLFPYDGLRDP